MTATVPPRQGSAAATQGATGQPDPATEDILRRIVQDYDRRRSSRWGRFLLWLLRKTT